MVNNFFSGPAFFLKHRRLFFGVLRKHRSRKASQGTPGPSPTKAQAQLTHHGMEIKLTLWP
jgi:hypothetical protein